MVLDVVVPVPVRVTIDDVDPRRCGGSCAYKRAERCALFRSNVPDGYRCLSCVLNVPVVDAPQDPEFAHIRAPQRFTKPQLQDILAACDLTTDARNALARKWKTMDNIRPATSFTIADSEACGYGPADKNGFFAYSL